ncbi:hypothetical protein TNCV_4146441 [Trichonephila clavipes]|nr:hypothetical protein TNCV_4146441 [Trichonephila clavipes]
MNATEWINDGASTSAAGAVEIMQVDDKIRLRRHRLSTMVVYEDTLGSSWCSCVAANAIGDSNEQLQCDSSALESEVLLVRQNLSIIEAWMEDSMPVNVPGFDLRSSYNIAKRIYIIGVDITSSSYNDSGDAIYRNINSFID